MTTETSKPRLNPDLMVEVRGKTVPSYAGILDAAHHDGLVSIRTQLLQAPTEANGREAIVHATVTMRKEGETPRMFEALGDANPQNVNRPIALHVIRMAETRAKSRALRDAVNVGEALAEEYGDGGDEPEPARRAAPTDRGERALAGVRASAGGTNPAEFHQTQRTVAPKGPARGDHPDAGSAEWKALNGQFHGHLGRFGIPHDEANRATVHRALERLLELVPNSITTTRQIGVDALRIAVEACEKSRVVLPALADLVTREAPARNGQPATTGRGIGITDAQRNAIKSIARSKGMTPQAVEAFARKQFKCELDALDIDQASHVIAELQRV